MEITKIRNCLGAVGAKTGVLVVPKLWCIRIPTLGYLHLSGYKGWSIGIYQDTSVGLLVLLSGFISQGLGGNCGILVAIFYIFSMLSTK